MIDAYLYSKPIDKLWGLEKVDTKDYGKFSQYGNFKDYVKLNYPLTRAQVYQVKAVPGTSFQGVPSYKLLGSDLGKKLYWKPSILDRNVVIPENVEVSPIKVTRNGKKEQFTVDDNANAELFSARGSSAESSIVNVGGHRVRAGRAFDNSAKLTYPVFQGADIWKFNAGNYDNRWLSGDANFLQRAALNVVDSYGKPVITFGPWFD